MTDVTRCGHQNHEPVTSDGVTVARICTNCHEQLVVNWGCPDCAWVTSRTLGGKETLIPGWPCLAHKGALT